MTVRAPGSIVNTLPALTASVAVALAYPVVLPVLPTVVATSQSSARMTAELRAVYSAAMVVTAPIWEGPAALPAHQLVRLSLLGQTVAMTMLLRPSGTTILLFARGLQGIFASAALPALKTAASHAARSEGDRSQRLADLSRAALVGGLFGPGVGGATATNGDLTAPVLIAVAVLVLAAVAQRPGTSSPAIALPDSIARPRHRDVVALLALAALAAAAMSVHEVGLATRARLVEGLSAREVGFMFTGCGVVMLLSQSLVFRPHHDPLRAFGWVGPAFVATAAGLALLAWLGGTWPSAGGLVLVAAGAGVLQPALTYWISRAAGDAQATSLGWRASVTTAGQTLGSLAGGVAFAATIAGNTALGALLVALLAAALFALARRRSPAGLPRPIPTHAR